ncbi:uncharacterized protein EAE98_008820 [Botrytis deweyae]|uniref:Carrier domain-containing protein n=1 Tax=Botrytis deweyae TaxID=2478750 RepID=A0ABQ7ID83_9HELO|nr:uncharacterized protein EAE98_008820 [Botrytis deweyae]KAF7920791.1 hypothetical protein EAE98_008820 [Botrytis deweyae]
MVHPANGTAQPLLIAFISIGRQSERPQKTTINLSSNKRLSAIVPEITKKLSSKLPRYMMPTAWRFLEQMPFNGNGKTDRKRLNARASEFSMQLFSKYGSMPVEYQPPTTPTEKEMQRIWSQALKLERSCIGINDKLFRLGGDSITAMRLVAMFRDNGFKISVDEIFKHPTIYQIAFISLSLLPNHFLVDEIRREAAEERGVLLDSVENIYPCTPFQESLMALSIKQKGAYMAQLTYRIPESVDLGQFEMACILDVDHKKAEVYWVSQLLDTSAEEFCKRPTPDYTPISHHKLKKSIIFTKENSLGVTKVIIDSGADVETHFDDTMIAPWQITRIVSQLEFVIQQLCRANVINRIQDIKYISAADFKELYKWNSGVGPAIMETLHGLVDEAAQRNPSGQAIASSAGCRLEGALSCNEAEKARNSELRIHRFLLSNPSSLRHPLLLFSLLV